MRKRIGAMVLAVCLVAALVLVRLRAATEKTVWSCIGDDITIEYTIDDSLSSPYEATITKCDSRVSGTSSATSLVIPDMLDGLKRPDGQKVTVTIQSIGPGCLSRL